MYPTTSLRKVLVALATIAAVLLIAATVASPALAQTKVKKVPLSSQNAALTGGEEIYQAVCAVCHGKTAEGGGPAVPALRKMVPDLTVLARQNGGEFPAARVQATLEGRGPTSHGSEEMPMWGPIFKSASNDSQAALRVSNLVAYLRSIQVK
jgi:mono/diheme cytochrome c family protein